MTRAVAVLLCVGILTASTSTKADEIYRLCGPESMGFIRTGKNLACVGGDPKWRSRNPARQGNQGSPDGASTAAMIMQGTAELSKKHGERRASLVASDCGYSPEVRDYGIRDLAPDQDPVARAAWNRDFKAYITCSDKIMGTKYRNEENKMKAELMSRVREIMATQNK